MVLNLSLAEAEALLTCAEEGAEGLLTDPSARRDYIGGASSVAACARGLNALSDAVRDARQARRARRDA